MTPEQVVELLTLIAELRGENRKLRTLAVQQQQRIAELEADGTPAPLPDAEPVAT